MEIEFTGEFESHITVALAPSQSIAVLQLWAADRQLKCLHIELARGQHASQPMLTRRGTGSLNDQLVAAEHLRQQLAEVGFAVTRIKIEAGPGNSGVPQTDADAEHHPPQRYFEHHIKLVLDETVDLAELARLAEEHAAHLSRNALRPIANGQHERFVTQRCWKVGRPAAAERLAKLTADLESAGHEIVEVEEEFVVHDSNLEIDAGWLTAQE